MLERSYEMKDNVEKLIRRIDVAKCEAEADFVIINANVVNVFLRKVALQNVSVVDDTLFRSSVSCTGVCFRGELPQRLWTLTIPLM